MCGIAGILRISRASASPQRASSHAIPESIPESWLDTLDASIAQRGPDGRGRVRDSTHINGRTITIALVQRRLSILDHAGGRQPMVALGGDITSSAPPLLHHGPSAEAHAPCTYQPLPDRDLVATVFNGCIYNHRALRPQLQAAGHTFASDHSDTEVLLHGVRAWGEHLSDHLDGMYAVALWQRSHGTLALLRDGAGEKPLYAATLTIDGDEVLAFSSSAAGILAWMKLVGHTPRIDPLGAALWLKHGYWPRLPVQGLIEITPGATHIFAPDRDIAAALATPRRQLIPRDFGRTSAQPEAPLTPANVQAMLSSAIVSRLDADVPIGCFLSGGVDSSVVAAVAQQALAASGRRLRTFNVRMPDERFDESPFAQMVAKHLGTDHTELTCETSAARDLQALIAQLGLPFGDSSLLPTYWVSAAARKHVTVALGGDGGDELFGGYARYQANAAMARWTWLTPAARALPAALASRLGGNIGRITTALRNAGYDDLHSNLRTPHIQALFGADRASQLLVQAYAQRNVGPDARQDDFALYLPLDLMRKVDTASMSVALEVRAPLLERGLVGRALRATLSDVFAGEGRKGLLRQVARSLVPAEAIDRKKQGFGVPMGRWLREDFGGLRTLMLERFNTPDPWPGLDLSKQAALAMLAEHDAQSKDHGQRLYALTVLSLWLAKL